MPPIPNMPLLDAQLARGFDKRFDPSSPSHNEDPLGEEAYQRAFHTAARMKPPRIPNPYSYPNSPTAVAYLKSRPSQFIDTQHDRVVNSCYVPPPSDAHSLRRAERRTRPDSMDIDTGANRSIRNDSGSSSDSSPMSIGRPAYEHGDNHQPTIRAPPHLSQPPGGGHRVPNLPPLAQHSNFHSFHHQGGHPQSQQYPSHHNQQPADGQHHSPTTMEPQMQAPGPRNPFHPFR